jgi:hypothetical protein
MKRGTMPHDHHVYMLLADSAAERRDLAGLREYTPKLEALAERDQHRLYQGIAHRAHGVLSRLSGEIADGESHMNQALALFAELGTRWQLGRTLAELAEVDLVRADHAAARDHLTRALAEFEALGAAPHAARTRAALLDLS